MLLFPCSVSMVEVASSYVCVPICRLATSKRPVMSEGGQVGVVAHPRRNGWSCPPHPLQILVWCVIIVLAVLHYGVLVFYIPGLWRILAYVVSIITRRYINPLR